MSIGGYFVNDEAEKAAKWDALEKLRKLKDHRSTLTDAMSEHGEALRAFSDVLQNPKEYALDVRPQEIVAGKNQRLAARIESSHLDWNRMSTLIADYLKTMREIAELEPRFRDLKE